MITKSYKAYLIIILSCWGIATHGYHAENFNEAKRTARLIWSDHRETFYCGCHYDRQGNIDFDSCSFIPKDKRASKRISWEHIVPVSWYGITLPCWQMNRQNHPREACRKQESKFRKMEADLHNLVPAIREINTKRQAYGYAVLKKEPVSGCDFRLDPHAKLVEPRDEVKGMTARIMLYVSEKYQISLKPAQKKLLLSWHKRFPPDPWEKRWHEKVYAIQGDRNPYIDYYNSKSGRG